MKKRFVSKNRKVSFILKLFMWLLVVALSLIVTFNVLLKTSLEGLIGNEELPINLFLEGTNNKKFLSFDLLDPTDLLKFGLGYEIDYTPPALLDEVKLMSKFENPKNPLIYVYSSHDQEAYDSTLFEAYNINYTVTTGRYILAERLNELGIPAYVESESMSDYLKANNLNYNYSYYASKFYIEKRLQEYPSIDLIIDIHRDGIPRSASVAYIDGKAYAKVYFIVAVDYDGYEKNVALAERINSLLPQGLSRGISKGNGYGANGVFNQDLKDQALLLEIGGQENTIEEVSNTMEVLAKALFEHYQGGN